MSDHSWSSKATSTKKEKACREKCKHEMCICQWHLHCIRYGVAFYASLWFRQSAVFQLLPRDAIIARYMQWPPVCQSGVQSKRSNTVFLLPRLHDKTGCHAGCQTALTTGWMFVYTIQPAVKPVWQQVVSLWICCSVAANHGREFTWRHIWRVVDVI